MNNTLYNFNYPSTLLRDFTYWVVLLRPRQITLGSLILASKDKSESLADISVEAFQELKIITKQIDKTLKFNFDFDKINYLAYMMIDNHVHFHVTPRYSTIKKFNEIEFKDVSRPKPPNMSYHQKLSDLDFKKLFIFLSNKWNH